MAIHSSLVDPVAPVHLIRRMRDVWQSASVAKMSTITSSTVKSATTLQWTVNLNYYLLEQVGEILLDIANPRERFFIWTFFPGPPSVARFINLSRGVRARIAKGGQISIGPYIFRWCPHSCLATKPNRDR